MWVLEILSFHVCLLLNFCWAALFRTFLRVSLILSLDLRCHQESVQSGPQRVAHSLGQRKVVCAFQAQRSQVGLTAPCGPACSVTPAQVRAQTATPLQRMCTCACVFMCMCAHTPVCMFREEHAIQAPALLVEK